MSKVECIYAATCSGCQLLDLNYAEQKTRKVQHLHDLLQAHSLTHKTPVTFISIQEAHLRDRLDFTWTEGRLGLFAKDHSGIVDLEFCQQLSPDLQSWLTEFRRIQWPLQKASFRLRVGPQRQKGLWIDAANIDIKALLDEKEILRSLQRICFVEIGQRRKVPVETAEGFKLRDPEWHIWFQSWMNNQAVDLYCQVASFTQPSLVANRKICEVIEAWIAELPAAPRILEFGSGIGNLSFPALAHARSLTACEVDAMALEGFRRSLEAMGLEQKVRIHAGDFQKKLSEDFAQFDLILCNPPRSGLMNFLNPLQNLEESQRPPAILYMSCFPESLCVDIEKLAGIGYEIEKIQIMDQFPQTEHYEVLCLLQRK